MPNKKSKVVTIASREAILKRKIRTHLQDLGFTKSERGSLQISGESKEIIRTLHRPQREQRLESNRAFLSSKGMGLLHYFAAGQDVDPSKITPVLERVATGTPEGDLFRLASLTWSVPVSNGFGRRLRYLIWDESNGKLMGLLAIGDPVFNLAARDNFVGWDTDDRCARLVNVMDAYVLGALPPYNALLGGKLVACLLRSRDLYDDFMKAYGTRTGVISNEKKGARLLAVTTSSSMGRSSVYNRLKLNGESYLRSIGYTGGWGHFHIPDELFADLRDYLRTIDHKYADQHQFGKGPNWKLRTTKAALSALDFKEDMLRHGIKREVFIGLLASNAERILKTGKGRPDIGSLLSAKEISEAAIERWMLPRAKRKPEYQNWSESDLVKLFGTQTLSIQRQLKMARTKGTKLWLSV